MVAPDPMPWDIIDDTHDMGNHRVDEHLTFVDDDKPLDLTEKFAEPDPDLIKKQRRANGAKSYEDKVTDILQMGVVATVERPGTVVDAAAILLHGDKVSYALGDLAAENEKAAHVIDFLHGGTGNVTVAAVMATLPLVLQVVRNHEPQIESLTRINLPFTKGRIGFTVPTRLKMRFTNNKILSSATNDPAQVYAQAFQPDVVLALKEKFKVNVADYSARHRSAD